VDVRCVQPTIGLKACEGVGIIQVG